MRRRLVLGGQRLAFQRWGSNTSPEKRVLCLHGWLDNSSSFANLAPVLAEAGYETICLDLPGHGRSSHSGGFFLQYVATIKNFLDAVGWQQALVIGHSMGAGISLCFAGSFPERISKLCLIDGFGPYTQPADKACVSLRKAIEGEAKYQSTIKARGVGGKLYPSLQACIDARMASVASYPGSQSISLEAATNLCRRGVMQVATAEAGMLDLEGKQEEGVEEDDPLTDPGEAAEEGAKFRFRHDPRLLLPSYSYLSNENVDSFAACITCPTLLILAENGWPYNPADYENRIAIMQKKNLLQLHHLAGSHHLHLDTDTHSQSSQLILSFLEQQVSASRTIESSDGTTQKGEEFNPALLI